MGAVTALRYLDKERDLSIAGCLVDSPFTTLVDLIHELTRQKRIPRMATNIVLHYINKVVQAKAGFNIREVSTVESAGECWVPALLMHGQEDAMIPVDHSKQVLKSYSVKMSLLCNHHRRVLSFIISLTLSSNCNAL
jgi:alpha-beta hydrolase superfamily lysophospholipase